jgi:hypothetical protein
LFTGRIQKRKIFPIRASIPNEVITVPSLFDSESQAKLRMIFYAHRWTIRPTHIRESPSQEISEDLDDPNSFPSRCLTRAAGIIIGGEAARRMFYRSDFFQQTETWRLYNGMIRHAATQHLNEAPTPKRLKRGIVTLASPTKELISIALQTLILVTEDWAFVMMADGMGKLQRSAYIPDQTTQTVSSSPLKYLLLRNLEQLEYWEGDTDIIYKTLKRDLQSFLALHTSWAPHSEYPQTRVTRYWHRETDSLDFYISIQRSKQDCEEQPVLIVHQTHLLLCMGNYTDEEKVRLHYWQPYGTGFVERLHSDGSRILHTRTRCEALRITHHSTAPSLDILFSSTRIHIRILVTKSLNLNRLFYSGGRGREGLVRLLA